MSGPCGQVVVRVNNPYSQAVLHKVDRGDKEQPTRRAKSAPRAEIAPRFVTFLGVEAPKMHDLQHEGRDGARLPLHAKPEAVRTFRPAAFAHMDSGAEKKHAATEALRWLHDVSKYESLLAKYVRRGVADEFRDLLGGRSRLSSAENEMMTAIRKFERTEQILASSNVFAVVEWLKRRRRPISEPLINDLFVDGDLPSTELPQKEFIRSRMQRYKFFAQLDAKAYYDQFELDDVVASFFGVGPGLRQRTLPMGFKPSCGIAQSVSECLLDFRGADEVERAAYIDNFLFWADDVTALRRAISIFMSRCADCGVLLNEKEATIFCASPTDGCLCEPFDCLGEHYDLSTRTRTLTTSTRDKLMTATAVIRSNELMPCRRLAAVFGILFFASAVFAPAVSPRRYFDSVHFYRQLAKYASEVGWSATAPRLPGPEAAQTEAWLLDALTQPPVPIMLPTEREADCTIIFDASDLGWGAVVSHKNVNRLLAGQWTPADHQRHALWSSVVSEPLAAVRAAIAAVPAEARRIRMVTDHQPLIFASRRGYAAARSYNEMLERLEVLFHGKQFFFEYVPGPRNPADPLSRGLLGWTECPQVRVGSAWPSVRVG